MSIGIITAAVDANIWDQIVIGAGSSAINFLYSSFKGKKFLEKRTLVIGKTDLWTPMDPDHNMGQPGKLLRGVEEWKKVGQKEDGEGIYQKQQYLSSGGYVKSLQNLKDTVQVQRKDEKLKMTLQFVNDMVATVKPFSDCYDVTTAKGRRYKARQIIVASGAGPGNKLNAGDRKIEIIGEELLQRRPRGYPEIIDATDYLYWEPKFVYLPRNMEVLIQGGSATASWAAAHAFQLGSDFIWLNAKGLQQIQSDGNPVARNTLTIRKAAVEKRIYRGRISRIEVLNVPFPQPRLKVHLTGVLDSALDSPLNNDGGPQDFSYTFHQVIHALGSNALGEFGPGQILDNSIRQNLQVLWDRDGNLQPEKTAIAMFHQNSASSSLWIVGASLFRGAGKDENLTKDIQKSYTSLNEMLTKASRPPEGIANLKVRIQALTGHAETDPAKFDWNLASPFQIENLLSAVYGNQISPDQRKQFADKIIKQRKTEEFLLPKDKVKKIVEAFKKETGLKIETKKLQLDLADINLRVGEKQVT
jgi:hypothetical protein